MKMKKARLIISIIFSLLIVAEICIGTYMVYSYCMEETEKLGVVLLLIFAPIYGTLILIPELEFWHVILYFVSDKKSKKVYKTVLNIIEGILAISILFFTLNDFFNFWSIELFQHLNWIWLSIIYFAVKFAHFCVWSLKDVS